MALTGNKQGQDSGEADLDSMGPVGLREYEKAKEHLRRNSGFDFDSFLEEVRKGRLFEEPLGPSAECLSVQQIADVVTGGGTPGPVVAAHLEACGVCRENVRTYRVLADRHCVEEPVPALAVSSPSRY